MLWSSVVVHSWVPLFPGQAGLAPWWNMEPRERSADTVSCQPLSASASHREWPSRSSTGQPKTFLILLWVLVPLQDDLKHVHVCAGVSTQVGPCQSNLPVPSAPYGSAAAQCRLLRHCGTLAGLHGHPQTDHHPVFTSTERAVRTIPQSASHFVREVGNLSTGLKINCYILKLCPSADGNSTTLISARNAYFQLWVVEGAFVHISIES